MSTKSIRPASQEQQEVCIDLPGESVKCWRSSDNLKVVLRKHRDVILDLKLGKGKTYTVQSTHSDFYNARDKKVVFAKRNDTVTFNDGERMHLWVSRGFQGALLLKCDNKLMMKIVPNEIDRNQYSNDPKTKPAPIIVALGQTPPPSPAVAQKPVVQQAIPTKLPQTAAAPADEECSVVCVVEGTLKGAPDKFLAYFKKGGGKSGLADLDPFDIATRNWILGQIASGGAYVADNWSWLRASIDGKTAQGLKLVGAKMHFVRGKVRFYFSGYSKFNLVFGRGGFGPGHERIISIFAGAGRTSSAFTAVAKGLIGSIKGNALVSFIFSSATSIAEWKDDMSKDKYDLAASLLTGLLKALVATAITAAIIALLMALVMGALSLSLAVLAVGTLTVGVGVIANYGVDLLDKSLGRSITADETSTEGLSGAIAPLLREAGQKIELNWKYLMGKFFTDYGEIAF